MGSKNRVHHVKTKCNPCTDDSWRAQAPGINPGTDDFPVAQYEGLTMMELAFN